MKKLLVFLVAIAFGVTTASAMTETELKEKLYEGTTVNGATFKPSDEEKTMIERYLDQYNVTSSEADLIWEKIQAAFDILKNSGKKKFQDMTSADKARVVALVSDVDSGTSLDCAIIDGVFIVYTPDTGKSDVFYKDPVYPIAQTNSGLLIAGLSVISVIGMALAFRKIKNA